MAARRNQVRHDGSDDEVDYDTDDRLDIIADGDDPVISEDSDLAAVDEEGERTADQGASSSSSAELLKSVEELAPLLQIIADGDDPVISEDSDLAAVNEEGERTADQGASSSSSAELLKLVEELAPLLQILSMEERLRLHIDRVCRIVADGDNLVVSKDSNLAAVVGKLRLVLIDEEGERAADQGAGGSSSAKLLKLVEELARLLQIIADGDDPVISEDSDLTAVNEEGERTADQGASSSSSADLLKLVEDPARLLQILGREERLRLYIDRVCGSLGMEERLRPYIDIVCKVGPSESKWDHDFLIQLLHWFKRSFSWVNANAPPCEGCGGETEYKGHGTPLRAELPYDCSGVEIYRCKRCSTETRFPRYNDPVKLLETRRGRCGEWANCFTFYCRAFGYEARQVVDFTGHVWTECFSVHLRRWMHLDPCEGVYDEPLLYEEGWNKELNYAFGIAKDGIYDVTKCYTKKWDEVLKRRNLITETSLSAVLAKLTEECGRITSQVLSAPEDCAGFHAADDASESLPGRQSGDK